MRKTILLFAAMLAISSNAFASQLGLYGGLQYQSIEDDENTELGVLSARLGSFLTENVSAEVRIGTGVSDHSERISGMKFSVEADTTLGAYLRGGVFITPRVYPYIIVGYTQFDYTAKLEGFGSFSDDESGTSLGIGAEFFINKKTGLTLEAMRLLDEDDIELDALNLGVVVNF
ncbi:porin family protein [Spongiibacter marinus]|uniref:porin family protein n=1 Tax=Spongiibacter marinus TaxID=354246 RepID=UPI0035BE503E